MADGTGGRRDMGWNCERRAGTLGTARVSAERGLLHENLEWKLDVVLKVSDCPYHSHWQLGPAWAFSIVLPLFA